MGRKYEIPPGRRPAAGRSQPRHRTAQPTPSSAGWPRRSPWGCPRARGGQAPRRALSSSVGHTPAPCRSPAPPDRNHSPSKRRFASKKLAMIMLTQE
eukprot:scaffold249702_cov16-Prasinocladus_malaysianus.AAC.1